MKKHNRMVCRRIWLFALLAVLATVLLGSTMYRGERRALNVTALALAEQSTQESRTAGRELALSRPGVLLRANTCVTH